MSSYWLVYWEEKKWPRSDGFYVRAHLLINLTFSLIFYSDGYLRHPRGVPSDYILLYGQHIRPAHVFCLAKPPQGAYESNMDCDPHQLGRTGSVEARDACCKNHLPACKDKNPDHSSQCPSSTRRYVLILSRSCPSHRSSSP